ncbi:CUT domain protein [Ancylostoma ceylanicum]|uniref:One cut domain family member n=1 Tax=Ancylostoma ceylanicum TaxID=53326 RepID=A0A0D6L9P9_9BILA|nr:CUT domain protein [Ancylostoma ceylanicum]
MEKVRRQAADYLQIDPSSTFINNATRNFEDLPENFLDNVSPQQSSQPLGTLMNDHANSPQLAPLAPMSIGSDQSFGTGPAGLLSPLHLDSHSRRHGGNPEFTRHVYIKEETDPLDTASHHLLMQQQIPLSSQQQQQQQELERIAQAETPPAVSNVELASTMIASLIGEQRTSSPSPQNYSVTVPQSSTSMMQHRIANIKRDTEDSLEGRSNGDDAELEMQRQQYSQKDNILAGRRVYSTKDSNDPLNAEIDDDIYIDTKELCKRIAYELKQHSIPQAIFAERILCRSQGTLSDLLRNPKPWNKLKSGRETFRRMFNWVQQPLAMRLGILDMYKQEGDDQSLGMGKPPAGCGLSPPTPAQNVRHSSRRSLGDPDQPSNKRPRLVFTDIQKRTLQQKQQPHNWLVHLIYVVKSVVMLFRKKCLSVSARKAIFKETQRPSREMQQTIAEHLRLDLSTVANFFMNARRRSRIGPNSDEPQPYQQVRPISPPPDSPPSGAAGSGVIGNGPPVAHPRNRRQPASMQHVEATVSSVAESAIQYSREQAAHDAAAMRTSSIDEESYKMYKMNDPLADETGISIVAGNVHDVYNNGSDTAVESLTSMSASPGNTMEQRGVVKKENDGLAEEATAQ